MWPSTYHFEPSICHFWGVCDFFHFLLWQRSRESKMWCWIIVGNYWYFLRIHPLNMRCLDIQNHSSLCLYDPLSTAVTTSQGYFLHIRPVKQLCYTFIAFTHCMYSDIKCLIVIVNIFHMRCLNVQNNSRLYCLIHLYSSRELTRWVFTLQT